MDDVIHKPRQLILPAVRHKPTNTTQPSLHLLKTVKSIRKPGRRNNTTPSRSNNALPSITSNRHTPTRSSLHNHLPLLNTQTQLETNNTTTHNDEDYTGYSAQKKSE